MLDMHASASVYHGLKNRKNTTSAYGQPSLKAVASMQMDSAEKRLQGRLRDAIVLFALIVTGASLCNLSQTGLSAMISPVMVELGIDVDAGQWLISSYILVLGIAVPVATYLQRRVSDRAFAICALSLFAGGSLIDFFAINFPIMLLGRVVQAISGGLLIPQLQTIAMTRFPENRRATATGIAGIGLGFAPNIGPTIGGGMEAAFGWRSFFLLTAVLSGVLIVLTLVFARNSNTGDSSARFEKLSFLYSTIGFGGVLLGLSQASSYGLASAWVWAPLLVGSVFLVLFVRRQRSVEQPLINLAIFDSRIFRIGLLAMCLLFASYLGPTLVIPLYVVDLLGGTPLDAGLIAFPSTFTAVIVNPLSGILADKFGVRKVVLVTGTLLIIGSVGCAIIDESTSLAQLTFFQTIRAIGVSGLIGPILAYALSGLDARIVPDGSASVALLRQASGSFGTAVMVFLVTALLPVSLAGETAGALSVFGPALPYQAALAFSALLAIILFGYIAARLK